MTSRPLRVAALGMGWWSDVLADAAKRSDKIDIVTCFTRSPDKRAAFAAKYGCKAAASYDEILADPSIDAVINTTPNNAHLETTRMAAVAGPADASANLRLGLLHAPEPRVLDAWSADGVDLMLAGHTHGGQVRLPGYGAIVTNCGIDRARAKGLSAYESSWLHVSPGLGTSPYAPIRFACRPEATLLRLTARA